MALALKSLKNTAFKLEEIIELTNQYFPGILPQHVVIESDANYSSIGYVVEIDNYLNNRSLIIKVIDVTKPSTGMLQIPGKAKNTAFQYMNGQSYGLNYDSIRKLLSGPKGTIIDIVLKDEHTNKGTEDVYELSL